MPVSPEAIAVFVDHVHIFMIKFVIEACSYFRTSSPKEFYLPDTNIIM